MPKSNESPITLNSHVDSRHDDPLLRCLIHGLLKSGTSCQKLTIGAVLPLAGVWYGDSLWFLVFSEISFFGVTSLATVYQLGGLGHSRFVLDFGNNRAEVLGAMQA